MASQGIIHGQSTPTGLFIAQTVGITASLYLLGKCILFYTDIYNTADTASA